MSTDLNEPEIFVDPIDDELPSEGVPLADNPEEEPAQIEQDA